MDEDVVITLTAKNPQMPQNIVRFDYTVGEYMNIKLVETMIDHLEIESTCLHKDSPEGKKQIQADGGLRNGKHFEIIIPTFHLHRYKKHGINITEGPFTHVNNFEPCQPMRDHF